MLRCNGENYGKRGQNGCKQPWIFAQNTKAMLINMIPLIHANGAWAWSGFWMKYEILLNKRIFSVKRNYPLAIDAFIHAVERFFLLLRSKKLVKIRWKFQSFEKSRICNNELLINFEDTNVLKIISRWGYLFYRCNSI